MSVYNAEKYIGKCIRSILNQTFGDFECIVIDDASNDSTYKMLTSFHDNRLKIIRNDDNLGLTKNLNYAIKISQGEYVARMDGDDICCCNRLQVQYDFMRSHPEVDVLGSNAYLIDDNDKIIGATLECNKNADIQVKMQLLNPMIHPTVIMKGSVIRHFMYNEKYRTCQDFELWNRIGNQCVFVNIPQETIFYRLNTTGVTRSAKNNIDDRVSMLYELLSPYRRGKFLATSNEKMIVLLGVTMQHHIIADDNLVFEIYKEVSDSHLNRIMAPSLFRFNWRLLLKRNLFQFYVGLYYWIRFSIKVFYCKYFNMKARSEYKKAVSLI